MIRVLDELVDKSIKDSCVSGNSMKGRWCRSAGPYACCREEIRESDLNSARPLKMIPPDRLKDPEEERQDRIFQCESSRSDSQGKNPQRVSRIEDGGQRFGHSKTRSFPEFYKAVLATTCLWLTSRLTLNTDMAYKWLVFPMKGDKECGDAINNGEVWRITRLVVKCELTRVDQ